MPNWRDLAACRGSTALFFVDDDISASQAKRICRSCLVQEPCQQAGMDERYGVWGGLSARDRKRQRRKRKRAA